MSDLPAGIVTFLLTDIGGSTRLWQEHLGRDPTGFALARHYRRLIKKNIDPNRLVELERQGAAMTLPEALALGLD